MADLPNPAVPQSAPPAAATARARSGIGLYVGAVFLFSCMDALAKELVQNTPALQVVWVRYLVQAIVITAILAPRLRKNSAKNLPLYTRNPLGHMIRGMFQIGATGFFFLALTQIGLAEATALADTSPVFITLGSALFLGEKLTRARVIAVGAALIGALIILRPGAEVFSPAAVLPLACALCYAGNALMTRALGQTEPAWTSLFYAAWFGTVILTLVLPFIWQPIALGEAWRYILLGLIGTAAQAAVILAFSRSEVGLIAPFGYLGIVFASFWATVIFNQPPDGPTVMGALVIVGAGLYVWRTTALGANPKGTSKDQSHKRPLSAP